ncbi:MAG: PaaI family thioesterase [Conexivisphaerales archaeon]
MEVGVLKEFIENDPFLKLLGVRVEKIQAGSCRLSLNYKKELTRFGNILNGGVTAALADAAGGCAALSYNLGKNEVTVDLSVSYLRPISEGKVSAESSILKGGESIAFTITNVYDGKGNLCAVAKGTYFYLNEFNI